MNLQDLVDEDAYQHMREPTWPTYQSVIRGDIGQDAEVRRRVCTLFDAAYDRYCQTLAGNKIAQGNQHSQQQVFYDKRLPSIDHCQVAWQTLGVNSYGDVFICESPAWIPKFVGNINSANDIFDILNSETALHIRNEIMQGRYRYCNLSLCSFGRSRPNFQINADPEMSARDMPTTDPGPVERRSELMLTKVPKNLIFDFDHTCNFRCPSCRVDVINHNKHPILRPIRDRISNSIKKLIIDQITNEDIEIRWAGGEIFISQVYLDLLEYIAQRQNHRIKHVIQTNGSYIKSRQALLESLTPSLKEIRVSFDAATADTYHKIRVNGQWSQLLENVEWLMNLNQQHGNAIKITADFVVQKHNCKEIPVFRELCRSLGIQNVNFQKMWNWNTWDAATFNDMNVWHEKHPEFPAVQVLLRSSRN